MLVNAPVFLVLLPIGPVKYEFAVTTCPVTLPPNVVEPETLNVVNDPVLAVVLPIGPGANKMLPMSLMPEMLSIVASVLAELSFMMTFKDTPPSTQMLVVSLPLLSSTMGLALAVSAPESVYVACGVVVPAM